MRVGAELLGAIPFLALGVWLLLSPESFIRVNLELKRRSGYAPASRPNPSVLRVFGAVWLIVLAFILFTRTRG